MNPFLDELMEAMSKGPLPCAAALDDLADKIRGIAAKIRSEAGYQDSGAFGDSVRMNVIGPDGRIKQTVDSRKR